MSLKLSLRARDAGFQNRAIPPFGPVTRMQRFLLPTTMPASDWRTALCSQELASTSLEACLEDARRARSWRRERVRWRAPVWKTAADARPHLDGDAILRVEAFPERQEK
jgi:hypothetical protein